MTNLNEFKELLAEYVAFPSISTNQQFKPDIQATVSWLKKQFADSGFETKIIEGNDCNPLVYAAYKVDNQAETVLVYGHYDVQPADQADGWDQNPFELNDQGDKWVARGVVDNKGQTLIHMYTVFQLIKAGKLKYNVKFLLEGNEETANPEMHDILKKNKELMQTDYVLVSDGEMADKYPLVEASLRGGANLKLTYRTANDALHSGIYGGAVPNAAQELIILINKIFLDNVVQVPGFYDNVDPIAKEFQENNEELAEINAQKLLDHAGIKQTLTEPGYDFFTQTGLRPTIEVTGFQSGYTGEGFANIVPHKAEVRLNFRLVASQDPHEVVAKFKEFVQKETPEYVDYKIETNGIHAPVKVSIVSQMVKEVRKLLAEAYQVKPYIKNVGGAIPFVGDIKEVLGIDTLLIPMGNDDCNMHGVNENFKVDLIEKGLRFSKMFFGK